MAALVPFHTPSAKTTKAIIKKYVGELSQINSIQSILTFLKIFTLYITGKQYNNKEEEKKKKEINSLVGSVRWSEELSFQADHRYIMWRNRLGLCLVVWQLWIIISICIVNFGS